MTADYTFLNERLAKHYGVPDVYGSHFRRVTLTDDARKGLLGKGAILMVTSHADRTSPVVRGKWMLDNLLSAPPPPMPANVPPLNERREPRRQGADDARADGRAPGEPGVRGCHKIMDPIGLVAGELRRGRRVAHARRRHAGQPDRRVGRAARRHEGRRRGDAAAGAAQAARDLRRHRDREADDLRARPRARVLRHAGGARDRPRRRPARTTGSRRSMLGIVNSTPFQKRIKMSRTARIRPSGPLRPTDADQAPTEGARDHVHHQDVVAPADVPARRGRHAGAAAARIDGAGADGDGEDGGQPAAPVRRDLRAAR